MTANEQAKVVSARLKALRAHMGKTQAQVAAAIGLTEQAYSGYETGFRMPGRNKLSALAEFFDVSIDYILGLSDLMVRHDGSVDLPPELQPYFRKGRWDSLVPNDRRRLLALIRGFMDESDPDTNPDTKE